VRLRDAVVRRPVTSEQRAAIAEMILLIEKLIDRDNDATAAVETLNETTGHSFVSRNHPWRVNICQAPLMSLPAGST